MVVRYSDSLAGKRLEAVDGQTVPPSAVPDARSDRGNVRRGHLVDRGLCVTQLPMRACVDCWLCLMMGVEVSTVVIESVRLRPLTWTVFRWWHTLPEVCY